MRGAIIKAKTKKAAEEILKIHYGITRYISCERVNSTVSLFRFELDSDELSNNDGIIKEE